MKSLQRLFGRGKALLSLLVMTALLAPARMMGQNQLTVYDGGDNNTLVPYSYYYRNQWQKCEFVIPASALAGMDATIQTPKLISDMTFYHNLYGYYTEWTTFRVFLEEVDFDDFEGQSSFHGYDGATIVYEGRLDYSEYKTKVLFDENFVYHGGSLLIGLYTTKAQIYAGYSSTAFYGTIVSNAALEGHDADPDNIQASIISFIPKTTFVYYDEDYCFAPDDLFYDESSITSTSVALDWTPRGNEQEWKIKYSDEDDNEIVIDGVTEHPYILTGLQPGAYYHDIGVCAVCGEDSDSDWTVNYYGITMPFCDPEDQCELHYELGSSINWGWDEQSIRVYYKPTEGESILVQELSANGSYTEGDLLLCDGGIYDFVWYVGYTGTLDRCSFTIYGPDGEPVLSYAPGEAPGSDYDDYEEMVLLEDYVINCPSCEKPWDFSVEPTANSATFTWEAESEQTTWQFQYSTDKANWSDLQTITETGYTNNQLTPATHYYARVRSVCGDNDYSAWVRLDFYTDCATVVVDAAHPYSENFDSYDPYDPWGGGEWKGMRLEPSDRLPLCWNSWNGSDDDEQGVYPYIFKDWENGSNVLNFYVYNEEGEGATLDQYAILPAMESVDGLMMSFRARDAESATTSFSVGVMTDPTDPGTFVEMQDFEVADEWDDFVVYFGTYQGQGEYMAIKVPTPGEYESYNLYVDDIEVSVMPTCFVPSGFAVSNVEENEVTLTWEPYGNETAWQVRYSTDENSWATVDYTEQNPGETVTKQLTGLNINTLYYVQVRANCGNEDYSAWSAMKSFRTLCGEYQPVPYYEDFETYQYPDLPQCWDRINTATDDSNSMYPLVSDSYINGENYLCLQFQFYKSIYFTPKDQTALLPRMENISSLQLSFEGCRTSVKNNHTADYKPVQVGVYDEENVFHSIATIDLSTEALTNYTVTFESYTGDGDIGRIAVYVPYFNSGWTQYYVYIDNVSITGQLDYKTFVTAGNWNVASNWENADMPTSLNDNALIQAAAVIPSGCVATANVIDFNGSASITIEDGGQLITNSAVQATVKKHIAPWTTDPAGGWYFIASPINSNLDPYYVPNLLTEDETVGGEYIHTYDFYYLDGANSIWKNYRNQNFDIESGKGYLYANANDQILEFTGAIQPYSTANNTVTLAQTGWNLIGNPFTCAVSVNKAFGEVNNGTSVTNKLANSTINPCAGIAVNGTAGETVTFTRVNQQSSAPNPSNLNVVLTQNNMRGNAIIDNAVVSFNADSQLPKFYFGEQNANLYIPQGGKEYAITYSDKQGEMPVNFRANEDGIYTLTVNPENVEMQYLHLIDNLTGADVDLLALRQAQGPAAYTFEARTTDYASRFRLVFASTGSATDNAGSANFAFFDGSEWTISNTGEATLQVVDMMGHVLVNETINGNANVTIDKASGVYVMRLVNGNEVRTQKIVVQ